VSDNGALLAVRGVRFGYPARPDFLGPIDLTIDRGQRWAVIGPNGAGKSTLVRLLAGLHAPSQGDIALDGRSLRHLSSIERARRIAFLPQHPPVDLHISVGELALLGRHPHRRFGLFESPLDQRIAEDAMRTTQTLEFRERLVSTLSGGEGQRAHLAAALAQQPALLVLDEPTTGLDLKHQLHVYDILRSLTAGQRMAVVVVTHDVNLAARYATHVLLLADGSAVATGPPAEVVRADVLERVYEIGLGQITDERGQRWLVPIAR